MPRPVVSDDVVAERERCALVVDSHLGAYDADADYLLTNLAAEIRGGSEAE